MNLKAIYCTTQCLFVLPCGVVVCCVCVLSTRSVCLLPLTLMETCLEPQLATLDSHYAGVAWTLTPNCQSLFQHTHVALCMYSTHTKQALRDKYTPRDKCRGIHTQTHVLIFLSCDIRLNILTNMPLLCSPLPPIPQMLCPAALQQRLISLLRTVYTMHALVELIESLTGLSQ